VLDANFGTRNATAIGNSIIYTGRQIDWETGLFYYRNRHYHAQLGGFVSRDPIGYESLDVNLYRYVFDNPLTHTDPSGFACDKYRNCATNGPWYCRGQARLLQFVCEHAGDSSWAICVRGCLEDAYDGDGCYYPGEVIGTGTLGPKTHAECFSVCAARELAKATTECTREAIKRKIREEIEKWKHWILVPYFL
jgi:RHS repeat-associated protein